jgi:hypothetical protein
MIAMKPIRMIPLQQIDFSDDAFSINFMPDLQRLRSSILEIGLIQPVLLRKKLGGYQIICGFRRVSVVKELGKAEIDARVFEEKEADEFQLFSLSIQENLSTRGFNTVEKAMALERLVHRFRIDSDTVIKTFLPLFSLEPNEKILNTFLSLAGMEDGFKEYVLKEEVSRSNIRKLANWSPDDRVAILSLISPLKLGENRLREILTFLEEISKRNQCQAKEIVQRANIQVILSQKEFTPSQRTERIKKILMDLRYPKMRQLEEEFQKKRRDLNIPSSVSLHHFPFFEGRGLRVEFQFETMEEYLTILNYLSNLAGKKEFEEMIKND